MKERVSFADSPRRDLSRKGQAERFLSHSLFQELEQYCRQKGDNYFFWLVIPCSAKASRGQAVHASVVQQEVDTCPVSWPMTTYERLLLFIPLLKARNQCQRQQGGLRMPKPACQPSPVSAGLHCHCIVIKETMRKVCFTDSRFLTGLAGLYTRV